MRGSRQTVFMRWVFPFIVGTIMGYFLLGFLVSKGEGQELEFIPPLLHDTSSNPAASPANPRVHGLALWEWNNRVYLIYADQLELYKREIRADGVIAYPSRSDFDVPAYGDRDLNLFNFSVCNTCRYGVAGYDVQGLLVWDAGTGPSPLFSTSRRWMDSGSIGAFTFKYGFKQYLIARVHASCQGNALVEITGIQPQNMRLIQCIADAVGTPIPVDAGFWIPNDNPQPGDMITGWVWLLDSSFRRVHAFQVTTVSGDPHLAAIGWTIKATWVLDHGIDLDMEHKVAVSAYTDGVKIWNIADPAAPALLHTFTVPLLVAAMTVEMNWPYVWLGTMHTNDVGSSHIFDITNPSNPREVSQSTWSSANYWNNYGYMGHKGGVWYNNNLFLSDNSVMRKFLLHAPPPDPPVFVDGFEDGTTGAWTEVGS